MRSKWLFWIFLLFLLTSFTGIAVYCYKNNPEIFWIVEIIALIAIILFFLLYKKLVKPYQSLLSGMELLREQDFSSRLHPVKNSEANQLIEIFNRMIGQLKNERLHLRERNHFLDLLVNASPQGLIVLDFDEKITEINPAGLQLLHIKNLTEFKGKTLNDLPVEFAKELATLPQDQDVVIQNSDDTIYKCSRSSFIDKGFNHPFILIEELTHQLKKIEKQSYERIIRMMSHEVNNSIGAIGSTLSVISDILKNEENEDIKDIITAVDASQERCGHLGKFISNLAEVVKIPEPTLSSVSLNELIRSVDALTRMECQRKNIELTISLPKDEIKTHLDGIQFEQVLVNIIKNAYEAIELNGKIQITLTPAPLSISIADNGPGITDEVRRNLFTPFFTTKSTGQGIGLTFVKEVLNNHNYKFDLITLDGWTTFSIFLE